MQTAGDEAQNTKRYQNSAAGTETQEPGRKEAEWKMASGSVGPFVVSADWQVTHTKTQLGFNAVQVLQLVYVCEQVSLQLKTI